MMERGISEKEVQEGIMQGLKALQKPNKILFSHKYYCIVAKKIKNAYYIITIKPRW